MKAEEVTLESGHVGAELCRMASENHADFLIVGFSQRPGKSGGCMSAPTPRYVLSFREKGKG